MKAGPAVAVFLLVMTAVRLALIGQFELSPDEAYYYLWSQKLDWAYFSKGPGVALAIRAGTALFGPTEFGVRFLSPLLGLATGLLLFSFARRLYGASVAAWAVVALGLTPIFQAGGVLMTIDPLSILFWTAALYAFWLALAASPRFTLWWPTAGLLVGAGFLAKYTNAVQLLGIALALALNPRWRGEFRRPGWWTMVAGFVPGAIPPLVWNAGHDWVTMAHLGARGGLTGGWAFHPEECLLFAGMHFGVYSPLLMAALAFALWHGLRALVARAGGHGAAASPKTLFLMAFAAPLIALYLALSCKRAGEANWTAPAFISLGVYGAKVWHDLAAGKRWAAKYAVAATAVALAMGLLVLNTDGLRALGVPWPYRLDPAARLRGWRATAATVGRVRDRFEAERGEKVFLIGNRYGLAAALTFYLPERRVEFPGHPPVYIPESQNIENQFSFWPRYDEFVERERLPAAARDEYYTEEQGVNLFVGRTALYVTDREQEKPPSSLKSGFDRSELIALIELRRRGEPLREVRVFACYDYRGLPL